MIRGITWTHIQSVWNHSGPSEVPLFRKPISFAVSYSKPALAKLPQSANPFRKFGHSIISVVRISAFSQSRAFSISPINNLFLPKAVLTFWKTTLSAILYLSSEDIDIPVPLRTFWLCSSPVFLAHCPKNKK